MGQQKSEFDFENFHRQEHRFLVMWFVGVCVWRLFVRFSKQHLVIWSDWQSAWPTMMQPSFNGLLTAWVVFYFTSPLFVLDCCFNEKLSLAIPCSTQQLIWRLIRSLVGKMVCLYAHTLPRNFVELNVDSSKRIGSEEWWLWILDCRNEEKLLDYM